MPNILLSMLFVALVFAQDASEGTEVLTLQKSQHDTYGHYLSDANGRAVYLFVNEAMEEGADPARMTEGVRRKAVPCLDQCLESWPPVMATEVVAGEGLNADLLYLSEVDGRSMVVYNGWPLYYFISDTQPGDTNGQGLGQAPNIWYLVTPEGTVNAEREE